VSDVDKPMSAGPLINIQNYTERSEEEAVKSNPMQRLEVVPIKDFPGDTIVSQLDPPRSRLFESSYYRSAHHSSERDFDTLRFKKFGVRNSSSIPGYRKLKQLDVK